VDARLPGIQDNVERLRSFADLANAQVSPSQITHRRGKNTDNEGLYSYVRIFERIPRNHTLRPVRGM